MQSVHILYGKVMFQILELLSWKQSLKNQDLMTYLVFFFLKVNIK